MTDTKLIGLSRTLARLQRIPEGVKTAAFEELKKQADALAAKITQAVPVDTGALKASIRVEPGSRPLSLKVLAGGSRTKRNMRRGTSTEFDYARAVEFGHTTEAGGLTPGQPFFFPVYRWKKKALKRAVGAAGRKAAKKIFEG
jgi:hypothetical protein